MGLATGNRRDWLYRVSLVGSSAAAEYRAPSRSTVPTSLLDEALVVGGLGLAVEVVFAARAYSSAALFGGALT